MPAILAQMRNPSHETHVEQNKKKAVDCVGSTFQSGWRIDDVRLWMPAMVHVFECDCTSAQSMEIMSCALSNRAIYTHRATPSFVYGFRIAVIYSEPVWLSDCFRAPEQRAVQIDWLKISRCSSSSVGADRPAGSVFYWVVNFNWDVGLDGRAFNYWFLAAAPERTISSQFVPTSRWFVCALCMKWFSGALQID